MRSNAGLFGGTCFVDSFPGSRPGAIAYKQPPAEVLPTAEGAIILLATLRRITSLLVRRPLSGLTLKLENSLVLFDNMVCSVSDRGHKRIRIQRFEDKAVEANTAEDVVDHNLVAEVPP
jgi:hypothetical protein